MISTSEVSACMSVELRPREEGEKDRQGSPRQAVGSFMWLANMTRPEINNASREVALHAHNPSAHTLENNSQELAYVKQTSDYLTSCRKVKPELTGLADFEYATT